MQKKVGLGNFRADLALFCAKYLPLLHFKNDQNFWEVPIFIIF